MEQLHWIPSRNQLKISAIVHIPQTEIDKNYPTIIYGHGFTGNKTGDNRMGVELARYLCEQGYAVIRFDYIGSGESEGDFATYTNFSGWNDDYNHVINWAKNQAFVDSNRIGIIGHSFGGAVVTYLAATRNDLQSVIALAPVYYLQKRFKETIIGEKRWNAALNGQTISNFYNKRYTLKPTFVEDLLNYDLTKTVQDVQVPISFIHGDEDEVLPYEDTVELYEATSIGEKELHILKGEVHLLTNSIHKYVSQWLEKTMNADS